MTDYKTILLSGTLTREVTREFRVPSWVTEKDFCRAIDEGWLATESHDAEDPYIWEISSLDWDLHAPQDLQYDAGGEEHPDVFPITETVRIDIDLHESRTIFLEVPPNTTEAGIRKLFDWHLDPRLFKLKDTPLKYDRNQDNGLPDTTFRVKDVTFSRDFEPGQTLPEEEQDQLLEWSKDES